MAIYESCSCTDGCQKNNQLIPQGPCILCNCDWESKIGRRVAVSLAFLEIKRFFLLALEMIIEFPVLQFSGAVKSLILSFIDVAVGIPCAFAAIYTIRKRQEQPCYSKVKILLKCVGLIIVMCAILNIMTLASIGYHVSVKQSTIKNKFNSSMHSYLTNKVNKYNLDAIQIDLQCCGHTTYTDWFSSNRQKANHAGSRKKMNLRAVNLDKEFRDHGVPFSCCNIHSLLPCIHIRMTEADVKTINSHGCSKILSLVLLRIVIFGYIITILAVIVYVILFCFIIKIARKPLPQDCPSDCSCLSSEVNSPRCPLIRQNSPCSCSSSSSSLTVGNEMTYPFGNRDSKILLAPSKSSRYWQNSTFRKKKKLKNNLISTSCSSLSDVSTSLDYCTNRATARIRPSTHKQHQISRKSSTISPKVDSR